MNLRASVVRSASCALTLTVGVNAFGQQPTPPTPIADRYRANATRLIAAALADNAAYNRLARLTDTFGHRLSGSASLEAAIDWILAEMKRDGLQNVRGEKAMVPHWVRGNESAVLVSPRSYRLHMLGLGRSVHSGIVLPALIRPFRS